MAERLIYTAAASFESARKVEVLPIGHRSRRLHGHSFLARVRAELPKGWSSFPGGESDALREQLVKCVYDLDFEFHKKYLKVKTDEKLDT